MKKIKIIATSSLLVLLNSQGITQTNSMNMDCSDPMHAAMAACNSKEVEIKKVTAESATVTANVVADMDHSKMDMTKPMADMDHSKMDMTKPMADMDHSKMDMTKPMADMDHSKMDMTKPMADMDHSKMDMTKPMADMDHSKMDMTKPMADMDHSKMDMTKPMADMDHSKMDMTKPMADMDHSKMNMTKPMAGMDHSKMDMTKPMADMDHSKMDMTKPMADMDHSKMDMTKPMAGMDHSKMDMTKPMAGMDHSKMDMTKPMAGMDHSKMDMTKPMAGMDHSKMDMTKPMAGMDHSKMGGPKIPISDGSSAVYIPAPYPEAVHFMDDPMIISAKADRLDFYQKETDKYPVSFEGNIWVGKDINKFEISAEIESDGDQIEELQSHAFYRRAISPYWDAKVGIRHDSKPKDRTYAMFGFTGLAPYNVEIDTALYVGKHGQAAAKFFAEKEFSFNRKTTLIPEIEVNFYKNNDPEVGIGSGLSDLTASLRLQYAITPNISPYIGVSWEKKFGNTAKYAEAEGEKTSDAKAFIGIQAWY